MTFRHDINGLRAIAVIAVVLYHFGVAGFKGGFAGVDIFFIISGYLMTGIIFSKFEKNSFNLIDFYLARAARIIPALVVLCIVLTIAAWFFLPPYEMRQFGKHVFGAASFLSNIIFAKDSGYFDGSSEEKWFLHTWSLSVEWQFYILYPLFIIALRKLFSADTTRWTLLALAAGSFLLSAFFPARLNDEAFYLLPTRAWEMMAGGLIYVFSLQAAQKSKLMVETAGIALIAGSIVLLDSSYAWPGSLAALPVLGAALMIVAANEKSPVTNNAFSQYLGTISYSLYLWHWPVVVAVNLLNLKGNNWAICGGIALSVALATLSYYLVERPWRSARSPKRSQLLPVLGYASVTGFVAAIGVGIFYLQGIPSRVDSFVAIADQEQNNRNPHSHCFVVPSQNPSSPMCVLGEDKNKIAAIVIGDSHSNATVTAVVEATPKEKGGILFLGADGCTAMMNLSTPYFFSCGEYNKKILDYLSSNLIGTPIIVINYISRDLLAPSQHTGRKPTYLDKVPNTSPEFSGKFQQEYQAQLCKLTSKHPVYVVQSIPKMKVHVPKTIVRSMLYKSEKIEVAISRNELFKNEGDVRSFMRDAITACNAHELDPVEYLCNDTSCIGSINSRPLYYDDNHLSEYGNRLLVPMFRNIWNTQPTLSQH